jgi:transcriptional regulator with XRE-family HTH domain
MSNRSVNRLFEKWRQDPEFVAAYDALEGEFSVARALIEARAKARLTQAELADRIGTNQANISRWEGGAATPNVNTLRRIADALGFKLVIGFEPPARKPGTRKRVIRKAA